MMQVYYTPTNQSDWILLRESCPVSVQIAAAELLDNEGDTYQISLLLEEIAPYLKLRGISVDPRELKFLRFEHVTRTVTLDFSSGQTINFRNIPRLDTLTGAKSMESNTASGQSQKSGLTSGVKLDKDKLDWSLLPPDEIEEIVKVLHYGARKYEPDNWKKVDNGRKRYFNAALRHLWAWWKGESKDPESGLSHLAHATCCFMFLMWMEKNNNKNDGEMGQAVPEPSGLSGGVVQGPEDASWFRDRGLPVPSYLIGL